MENSLNKIFKLTANNAGNTSRTTRIDGVPMILLILCSPNFRLKTPARFSRHRIYCPHKHLPWVIMSAVGIVCFHPIVLDNFRLKASPTLLSRRLADSAAGSPSSEPALILRLNLRRVKDGTVKVLDEMRFVSSEIVSDWAAAIVSCWKKKKQRLSALKLSPLRNWSIKPPMAAASREIFFCETHFSKVCLRTLWFTDQRPHAFSVKTNKHFR